jgi:hypothetical protein
MWYQKEVKCKHCKNNYIYKIYIDRDNTFQAYSSILRDGEILLNENSIINTITKDNGKNVYTISLNCPYCNENDETILIEK